MLGERYGPPPPVVNARRGGREAEEQGEGPRALPGSPDQLICRSCWPVGPAPAAPVAVPRRAGYAERDDPARRPDRVLTNAMASAPGHSAAIGWRDSNSAASSSAACSQPDCGGDLRFLATRRDRWCPLGSPSRRSGVYPACTAGSGPVRSRTPLALRPSATRDRIGRPGTARPMWIFALPDAFAVVSRLWQPRG